MPVPHGHPRSPEQRALAGALRADQHLLARPHLDAGLLERRPAIGERDGQILEHEVAIWICDPVDPAGLLAERLDRQQRVAQRRDPQQRRRQSAIWETWSTNQAQPLHLVEGAATIIRPPNERSPPK